MSWSRWMRPGTRTTGRHRNESESRRHRAMTAKRMVETAWPNLGYALVPHAAAK
jgi:hypothetical protein